MMFFCDGGFAMRGKRWITTLIVAAMMLICTGTVYADKTITGLGTGAIANPDAQNGGGWSYVYYGKYSGSPVKYRVLDKASTDFGVTGGSLLLDCDTILYNAYYNDGNIGFWANSSLRGGLNGGSFLNKAGVFTGAELDAIAVSKKAAGGLFAPLTSDEDHQDRIFILDNEESLMKP